MRLSDFLRLCHGYSRRMITRLKQEQAAVTVNGVTPERLTETVHPGDVVEVFLRGEEPRFSPNPALSIPVLYEDDALVVFDKPAGVPVHPSYRHQEDTLANAFAARYVGQAVSFHVMNRLDRDTSGACVVAKDPLAAAALTGAVEKVYYAAVQGTVEPPCGTLSFPIARRGESIILREVRPDGKPAVTHYETCRTGNGITLLKIRLETGRTHQIRVHFSHIGHPLAGDDLYGGSREKLGRQALHCGEVTFRHPADGRLLTVSAPLPEEIARLTEETGAPFCENP